MVSQSTTAGVVSEDLRVERIEVIPLRVELQRTFRGSGYAIDTRRTIITRVYTRGGIVGEAYLGDSDLEQAGIVEIIRDVLTPLALERDVLNVQGRWEAFFGATDDIRRNRVLTMQAIACVDTAIWDAIGKRFGVPLYQLWGGYRDAVPVIVIGGYYAPSRQDIVREMESYHEIGFAGCKFKVGGRSPQEDAERIRVAREAAGPDFLLMADANQGYSREEAIEFVRLTRDLDLLWLEEPCAWDNDRRLMRDVRLIGGLPTAAGQSEVARGPIRDLMVDAAIDFCNADVSMVGGPTEWRNIAAMAAAFDIRMAHHEEPHVSVHLLGAIPHGTYAECFHPERDPVFWGLLANRPAFRNGLYPAPEGPGLGLELDAGFIEKYRV